jgi:hypothetical protein
MTSPCVCSRIPAFILLCGAMWKRQLCDSSAVAFPHMRRIKRAPSLADLLHTCGGGGGGQLFFQLFVCARRIPLSPLISPEMSGICLLFVRCIYLRAFLRIQKLKVNERQRAGERKMKSEYSTAKTCFMEHQIR